MVQARPPTVSHPKLARVLPLGPQGERGTSRIDSHNQRASYIAIQYEPSPSWRLQSLPCDFVLPPLTRSLHVRSIDLDGFPQACHRVAFDPGVRTNHPPGCAACHAQMLRTIIRQHPPLRRLLHPPRATGGTEQPTGPRLQPRLRPLMASRSIGFTIADGAQRFLNASGGTGNWSIPNERLNN